MDIHGQQNLKIEPSAAILSRKGDTHDGGPSSQWYQELHAVAAK